MATQPTSVLDASTVGPVDLAVVVFDGSSVADEVGDAISDVVHSGTVRVIDLALVSAAPDAEVVGAQDLRETLHGTGFDELADTRFDLLTDEDLSAISASLEPGTVALVVVWENTWSARLGDIVRRAGGRLAAFERLPHSEVIAAIDSLAMEGEK